MDDAPMWPADKLPVGLLSGYRYQDRPRHERTTMASGPPKVRLKSRTPVRDFFFELKLTGGQLAYFEAWVERELDSGVRWFWLPLLDGSGVSRTLVQFQKIGQARAVSPGYWQLSCQCISYQRHALALTEDQLTLLLSANWLRRAGTRLHRVMESFIHGGWK